MKWEALDRILKKVQVDHLFFQIDSYEPTSIPIDTKSFLLCTHGP
jgi:hypothetical protein